MEQIFLKIDRVLSSLNLQSTILSEQFSYSLSLFSLVTLRSWVLRTRIGPILLQIAIISSSQMVPSIELRKSLKSNQNPKYDDHTRAKTLSDHLSIVSMF